MQAMLATDLPAQTFENTLDPRELEIVQAAVEQLDAEGIERGLEVTIETDFHEFARLRKAAGGTVNQTVDPEFSRLDTNAFWLRATDIASGAMAAVYGVKAFHVSNFMDLLRSERLWFDRGLHVVSPKLQIHDAYEPFGGVVTH